MSNPSQEPKRLREGKDFHSRVQKEWLTETFGAARPERRTNEGDPLEDGRHRGRMDVRMFDPEEPMAFVIELKDSDFDRMTDRRVRPNVARNRLQVSRYGEAVQANSGNGIEFVCLAIVYSREPSDPDRRDWIERYLSDYMTACFWHDTKRGAPVY